MIPAARQVFRSSRLGVLAALAILVLSLGLASPFFLTTNNMFNIGVAIALVGVVAAGSTLVMIAGGLDVSVGSTVALSGVSAASVLASTRSVTLAIAAGVVVGALAGLFNGLIITKLSINPLIATLGTLSVYRGLTFIVSDGVAIGVTEAPFLDIGSGRLAGIPNPLVILLVVFAVLAVVLHGTDIGRNVYAIGGNVEAARLAGIAVDRYKIGLYTLNGTLAGLAGVVLTARLGSGQPLAGTGLELDAIAAVVLGGVALAGGIGTMGGTVLGVLVLGVLNNGLTILAIDSFYQYVARGGVLLLAVALDQAGQARRERVQARSAERPGAPPGDPSHSTPADLARG